MDVDCSSLCYLNVCSIVYQARAIQDTVTRLINSLARIITQRLRR